MFSICTYLSMRLLTSSLERAKAVMEASWMRDKKAVLSSKSATVQVPFIRFMIRVQGMEACNVSLYQYTVNKAVELSTAWLKSCES